MASEVEGKRSDGDIERTYYGLPPQTPPPAYREQASRRSSKLAWTAGEGGAWPLPDGLVWTTGAASDDHKLSTAPSSVNEKDPSKLGPAIEVVSTPMRGLKYLRDDKIAEPNKRCQKILIVTVVLMAVVIVALAIGLGVGLHKLRNRHMKDDDDAGSLCTQRTCSTNGMCEEINWQGVRLAWCVCYPGYTGLDCEQSIGSCADTCQHGTCMAAPTGSRSTPPLVAMPMGAAPQNGPQPTPQSKARPGDSPPGSDPQPAPADNYPQYPSYSNWMPTNMPANQYYCVCNPGYEGQYCDIPATNKSHNPCDGVTCSYQGLCVPGSPGNQPPTDGSQTGMNPNPMSPFNPNPVDPYETNQGYPNSPNSDSPPPPPPNSNPSPRPPPDNGNSPSSFYNTPSKDYWCDCNDGFTGKDCEIATSSHKTSSPCSSYPCLNNGLCVDLFDDSSFVCVCARGYRGDTCQYTASEWRGQGGHSSGGYHPAGHPHW